MRLPRHLRQVVCSICHQPIDLTELSLVQQADLLDEPAPKHTNQECFSKEPRTRYTEE